MQPFLQFLVDFGSCDMDECHNEQQQLQYGSNASVWNKFVAVNRRSTKQEPMPILPSRRKKFRSFRRTMPYNSRPRQTIKPIPSTIVFWKKCKHISVAMIGNSPSDTILFLYFNISFIICRGLFYRCNKVLFRIVHL